MNWRKSSHCGPSFSCVEVADGVQVRDSDDPDGPALWFSTVAWRAFTTGIRASIPPESPGRQGDRDRRPARERDRVTDRERHPVLQYAPQAGGQRAGGQ
jgi:Domain of unknown function (DUF397)